MGRFHFFPLPVNFPIRQRVHEVSQKHYVSKTAQKAETVSWSEAEKPVSVRSTSMFLPLQVTFNHVQTVTGM